jgi:hypothetical protein
VASASRARADERAFHLLLNALNCPTTDPTLAGNLQDAFATARARIAVAGDDDALLSISPALQILPPHNASHHLASKKTNARTMRGPRHAFLL